MTPRRPERNSGGVRGSRHGARPRWRRRPRSAISRPMTSATMPAAPKGAPAPSARPLKAGDQIFLVDGSSFVFRAYFQSMNQDRKYNVRPSDGLPTGALRLFCTKLYQFIREGAVGIKP